MYRETEEVFPISMNHSKEKDKISKKLRNRETERDIFNNFNEFEKSEVIH